MMYKPPHEQCTGYKGTRKNAICRFYATINKPGKAASEAIAFIHYLRDMNFLRRSLIVCSFALAAGLSAQEVQGIAVTGESDFRPGPAKGFSLDAEYVYGVINNRYEIQRQYKSAIGFGIVYRTGQWFSVSAVITKFQRHDALSLSDCQAWTADVDGQLTMRLGQSDLYFRMIYGVGYTDWKGYYVGPNLNDNYHYYIGKLLNDKFYTANIGWGFSHFFYRQRMEGFGDFRLKFAADPRVMFSVRDTQFHFGVRYHIGRMGGERDKDGNAKRKTNSERKRRVYKWMKGR